MDEILIQPKYFRVTGEMEAVLIIYDYRVHDAVPDHEFQVLLNGKTLCSCSTKAGFLLVVSLPLGTYRVTLPFGRKGKSGIESVAVIDRRGEYGLRVIVAPKFLGFDELESHPSPSWMPGPPFA